MNKRDWFSDAFGRAADDTKRARSTGSDDPDDYDPVLHAKLYPDKIGESEFLSWLQDEQLKGEARDAPEPDPKRKSGRHTPDLDFSR